MLPLLSLGAAGRRGGQWSGRDHLPDEVIIAMVKMDIANRSRRVITRIVLDPEEPRVNSQSLIVHLKFLPAYIVVKLKRTRAGILDGLDRSKIPLEKTRYFGRCSWSDSPAFHTDPVCLAAHITKFDMRISGKFGRW